MINLMPLAHRGHGGGLETLLTLAPLVLFAAYLVWYRLRDRRGAGREQDAAADRSPEGGAA